MTRKHEQHSKLIAEAFHDDWASGRGAEFARMAAGVARRRRVIRQALPSAAAVLLIAALAFVFAPRRVVPPAVVIATVSPQPAVTRGYEIISDDELLAHLRDQPLLVVKKPNGAREITLLPQPEAATEPLE